MCVLRVCFFLLRLVNGMSRRGMSAAERGSDLFLFSHPPSFLFVCVCVCVPCHSFSRVIISDVICARLPSLIIIIIIILFFFLFILAAFIGILDCAGAARSSVDIKSWSSSRNLLCRPPPQPLPQKSKIFYSFFLSTRTNRSFNNSKKNLLWWSLVKWFNLVRLIVRCIWFCFVAAASAALVVALSIRFNVLALFTRCDITHYWNDKLEYIIVIESRVITQQCERQRKTKKSMLMSRLFLNRADGWHGKFHSYRIYSIF